MFTLLNDVNRMSNCLQMFIFDLNTAYQRKLRYTFSLFLILMGLVAFGQKVTGVVMDKTSQQAIAGALVTYNGRSTESNVTGIFEISATKLDDTLRVVMIGYKPFALMMTKTNLILRIELESDVITLKDVNINSTHSFKKDSLANRSDYAKQFNYTPPKLKNVIGMPTGDRPAQLLSINLLTLVNYLTYKSTNDYKFKQVLIRDEREQYVDEKFNQGLVSRITDLRGDTLTTFLAQYRPIYQFVLKSTDYDMEVYIKDCHKKFEKEGFAIKELFVKQD